jgi:NTE family protein
MGSRSLIDRLIAGNRIADESKLVSDKARGRMGAYWGIDTDPAKVNAPGALPCESATVQKLAQIGTRLSVGEQTSKQLVNWATPFAILAFARITKENLRRRTPYGPTQKLALAD